MLNLAHREEEPGKVRDQLARRNIAEFDRVKLAERRRSSLEVKAKARQATSTGGSNPQLVQNFTQAVEDSGRVRDQLAREAGVSGPTYSSLAKVVHSGVPELVQATREKVIGASTAARIASLLYESEVIRS